MRHGHGVRACIVAVSWALAVPARVDAEPATEDDSKASVTIGGYFEEYYQLSFQNPSNRITNLRGYDNRSRTFTLSNLAVDVKGETGAFTEHVVLQIGHTPSTYYLDEPTSIGTSCGSTSRPRRSPRSYPTSSCSPRGCSWRRSASR
jgi:hypothetical protein